jgi:L-lactate dehydrogenase complex protein LldG
MSEARDRILDRLRANRPHEVSVPLVYQKPLGWDREQCIAHFSERMQAVRGEVHRIGRNDWVNWVNTEMASRQMNRALIGKSQIAEQFAAGASDAFELTRYDRKIEEWKDTLFHEIDFSITGSLAGLAESGSLVLWPDAGEPRLMSLVPPLHIALLDADRLFENFAQLIEKEDWAARMPTNALLISGPSKTADIEQTLAYGIHGPKQLITLILE